MKFWMYIYLRKVWRYQRSIRSRYSKKDKQCNGQKKNDKRTNNGLQNITQKTEYQATQTPLKPAMNHVPWKLRISYTMKYNTLLYCQQKELKEQTDQEYQSRNNLKSIYFSPWVFIRNFTDTLVISTIQLLLCYLTENNLIILSFFEQ